MKRCAAFAVAAVLVACDVPRPPGSTGGTTLEAGVRTDANAPDGETVTCLRGFAVAESDYSSTNVALLAPDGTVTSAEFASSATPSVGLTAPLSGDVVLPTDPSGGGSLVLVDESTASRIDWVDLKTVAVTSLTVGTGFYSDPQDYVVVSDHKAYVPRLDQNASPGKTQFDTGSDVLVVDPTGPSITGSIDLRPVLGTDYPAAFPRPSRVTKIDDRAYVLLETLNNDTNFTATRPSRIAAIDIATDAVVDSVVLDGFLNCAGLAPSPDGTELAVLCVSNPLNAAHPLDGSGVVLVGIDGALRVRRSFRAADLGSTPIYYFGDYAAPGVLLFTTYGNLDATTGATIASDTLVELDLSTGSPEVLLMGDPFTLGGVACDSPCGVCFAADAGSNGGVVHRYDVVGGRATNERAIKVETRIGLPPRYVGKF